MQSLHKTTWRGANEASVTGLLFVVLTSLRVSAQTTPSDLVGLSLDDLLSIEIVQFMDDHSGNTLEQFEDTGSKRQAGYRDMHVLFDGYQNGRNGTRRQSIQKLLESFPVVPFRMRSLTS